MAQQTIRTTWVVRFTRENGDNWPDLAWYDRERMIRPDLVEVTIIAQPGGAPEVYHADVHGARIRKDGSAGAFMSRGWAGEYVTREDTPLPVKAPGWVAELARQALAAIRHGTGQEATDLRYALAEIDRNGFGDCVDDDSIIESAARRYLEIITQQTGELA